MKNLENTSVSEPDFSYGGLYSYADYLRWNIDERLELIKGKIFRMSPAPNRYHQDISGTLFLKLGIFLAGEDCKVYAAPFDVRLPVKSKKDKDVLTVVQPDICVICDTSKLDDKGCIGAPDIVIEILSPGNNSKELRHKYDVYEEAGVKEYWIVSPQDQSFLFYTLIGGKFQPSKLMTSEESFVSSVLPGLELQLSDVFSQ